MITPNSFKVLRSIKAKAALEALLQEYLNRLIQALLVQDGGHPLPRCYTHNTKGHLKYLVGSDWEGWICIYSENRCPPSFAHSSHHWIFLHIPVTTIACMLGFVGGVVVNTAEDCVKSNTELRKEPNDQGKNPPVWEECPWKVEGSDVRSTQRTSQIAAK